MKTAAMVFCAVVSVFAAQESMLQGTVVNQYGTIVPAARLEWKQKGVGTGLDSNGAFQLPLSTISSDELCISAYGFVDTVLAHAAVQSPLSITLYPLAGKVRLTGTGIPEGMKPITGGTFQMGSGLLRTTRVSSFWMDSTEVTVSVFDTVMKHYPWYTGHRLDIPIGPGIPLSRVSWDEATLYCNARSKRDGLDTVYSYSSISTSRYPIELINRTTHFERNGYRLPTEAEWEYASRGFSTTYNYWGHSKSSQDIAKYVVAANSANDIKPVASKVPNVFGLYDMVGNLSERTNDMRGPTPDSVQLDPIGTPTGEWNVIQGHWENMIAGYPGGLSGAISVATNLTGFRVVLRDTKRIPMLPDPHVVVVPLDPAFSSRAEAGNPVTFYPVRKSLCTKAHTVSFRYLWGDGNTSSWLGGTSHQHTYRDSGTYRVKVQARCTVDTSVISGFSGEKKIDITGPHFVSPQPLISGPIKGRAGLSLSFDIVPVLCNKGHPIQYLFDWNDGFTSKTSTNKVSHCFLHGGRYTIRAFAQCTWGICSDTSPMTITVEDTNIAVAQGNYRSGIHYSIIRKSTGFDFSDSIFKQSDLVFTGYTIGKMTFYAPYGTYDMGSITSPTTSRYLNNADSTLRNLKHTMDSIVASMRIVVPENDFQCCTTAVDYNTHPVIIVKTSEGCYGLYILVHFWAGANNHATYYWGYQSDGGRLFSPNVPPVSGAQYQKTARRVSLKISAVFSRDRIVVNFPGSNPNGEISLFNVRGCLVKRLFTAGSQKASIDLRDLPKAAYVLKAKSGKQEHISRFFRMH